MSDVLYADKVTCPYCGHKETDSWEYEDGEYECGTCGRSYVVELSVTVTYSTYEVESRDNL